MALEYVLRIGKIREFIPKNLRSRILVSRVKIRTVTCCGNIFFGETGKSGNGEIVLPGNLFKPFPRISGFVVLHILFSVPFTVIRFDPGFGKLLARS